jgi:hypothetical protein
MSYTLRGRLETRLGAALIPFLAACVLALGLDDWWPLQLAGLMTAVGVGLDLAAYHRLLPYQAGWLALPLGLLELGLTMGLARAFDVEAPLYAALVFFAASWLTAQALAHAGFPLVWLSYAEDGGELGRTGRLLLAAGPAAAAAVLGIAWVAQPPTIYLSSGVHQGPLVLDRAQRLIGRPGATVHGGIRITADDVLVRGVTVVGGENGIEVDRAQNVRLEDVTVTRSTLDGIHVRRGTVEIRNCVIAFLQGEYTQGIDISFSFDLGESIVEGCKVLGAREGIVANSVRARLVGNRVFDSTLRGISVNEMSMGAVSRNLVTDSIGVGIYCGDYSHCEIDDNAVVNTRADRNSDDGLRRGYGILVHYWAVAGVSDNNLTGNPRGIGSFADARIEHD